MDKSWGGDPSATFRIRSNEGPDERAAARARAREARAAERGNAIAQRVEARASTREADVAAREAARAERRRSEELLASGDPHAAAARRHRSSGRRDVVREQRDTSTYTMVVDVRRMRELAKRGASLSGLATAFGRSEAEVEQALLQLEEADSGD